MQFTLLAGFVGVALVAYLVPGPDWLIVVRGATMSARHGAITGLGTQAGLLVHGLLATVGVSAVVAAAPWALLAIQVAGAIYIGYLGISGLRRRGADAEVGPTGWRQAFVTNLTNPKVIVFFVAVAPQFVDTGSAVWPQMLVLTVVDVVIGIIWWVLLAYLLRPVIARVGPARIARVASVLLVVVAVALLAYSVVEYL
ncbi:LysE family translocator [Gordonia soli]|uniref:Amino acid efflux protein n=1 Tax=Gordonia soli NBRC 108243 TaxID=1223545 RepID=M0QGK0_9ACTN|nr:LysE family translocator [Gordonia soli]GAC66532.1 hypothetical protein GS4_02_02430 [Gordonia soli NBRC 108243]